jgi:hypothetical protein
MLLSGSSTTPAWSTVTHPATTTINQLLYSSSANVIAGVSVVNSAGLTTTSGGVPTWVAYTGSGAPVLANTPTLITPVLGAATATSINFGGSTLSAYASAISFTPTFTFDTVGDLSVAYTVQTGKYWQVGGLYLISYTIRFTPTYTTATGNARFGGLPASGGASNCILNVNISTQGVAFNAGGTMVVATVPSNYMNIISYGTATASSALTTANFLTGVQYTIIIQGMFGV